MSLTRTTPSEAGIDAAGILAFLDDTASRGLDLHSLMIALDGQVVAEGWWEPYSPDEIALVYSCSKSFTATAAGFLVTDGVLDVSVKLLDHLPWDELDTERAAVDPRWEEVRLEHLLSMTLGHEDDAWGPAMARFRPERDFVDTILELPPTHTPGTHFSYNQVATYLAARVIENIAGEPVLDLLRRRFFEPLGVGPVESHTDPKGRMLGFSGFHVRTEALLALAQLYLDEGRWGGEQLLSPEWVERARIPYGPANHGVEPDSEWAHGYGFSFWQCTHGYRGDGAFGQFALVLPQQRLAIAITSETHDMQAILEAVWRHLLPAVGRPGSAEADGELAERLASLTLLPTPEFTDATLDEPLHLTRTETDADGALPAEFDSATLARDGRGWLLTLHERGRHHEVPISDQWQHRRLDFERSTLGIATRGGWTDPDHFAADIVAVQTPHRFKVTVSRSDGTFTAATRLAPLGGTDPARIGLPGTGGRG